MLEMNHALQNFDPIVFIAGDLLRLAALIRRCFFLTLMLAVVPSAGFADTVTIGASKDTTIYQNNPNNSSGGGNGLFAGTDGDVSPRHALIAFDIADNIPAGATITDVQLTLFLGQVAGSGMGGGGGNSTIELHRAGRLERGNHPATKSAQRFFCHVGTRSPSR